MKMLMVVIDAAKREELEVFLNRSGVRGYTEISASAGLGASGPRLGSGAFPRTSAVLLALLSEQALARLETEVPRFCADCGEHLHMAAWDVREIETGRPAG